MTRIEIIAQFERINVWKSGSQRAPHKPLLILFALGKWVTRKQQSITYEETDPKLKELLVEFGPQRKSFHTEYPFSRLSNDGIWTINAIEGAEKRKGNTDIKKSELIRTGATGSFTSELYDTFKSDPTLVHELGQIVLDAHFPESMHQDIRQAVGLEYHYSLKQKPHRTRDPNFRYRVLVAYEQCCAVCGYNVRIGSTLVGVEAAHLKWFQAGGPDLPNNGMALCSLHHKLLDRGAFTLSFDRTIAISEIAYGSSGFESFLLNFKGSALRHPVSPEYILKEEFIDWHHKEVFKGPARI